MYKWLKACFNRDKNVFIQLSHYHSCWWPGDFRNKGISCHGIELIFLEYPSQSTRRVNSSLPGQMAAILQTNGFFLMTTTFSNAFLWIKCSVFFLFFFIQILLKFFPWGPIDNKLVFSSGNGLAPHRQQTIIWTNADPVHRCIYAARGRDELHLDINTLWHWVISPGIF